VEESMNTPSHEEFEEVESPFRPKPKVSRLRSKKSTFNRPFAADPTMAPAVFDKPKRKRAALNDEIELNDFRKSSVDETDIDYLEDEEDIEESFVEEKKRIKKSTSISKKTNPSSLSTFSKITWVVIGVLTLRLISMDRGVWDYFTTENNLQNKRHELKSVQKENRELLTEINRIKYDKGYQKQLAKEHLGVIAADEFLILFAGESMESAESNPDTRI